jgi:two-component sensor histidine kinase
LAVVLNELLQNAVDHAFPPPQGGACVEGTVRVTLAREGDEVVVDVVDDGIGLPGDFDLATGTGLGLSIVQTLVTTEMGGAIELHDDHGTRARLRVPVRAQSEVRR